MVRHIHVTLDDEEYSELERRKGGLSWLDFIRTLKK